MTFPEPASLLRHRPPAVLVGTAREFTEDRLVCTGIGPGPWTWPQLLEGGAQTAGLLAGTRPDGLTNRAVIADYRAVRVLAAAHAGPVAFTATLERRVLRFWRCRVEVHADDGTLLLSALVTLAPPSAETT